MSLNEEFHWHAAKLEDRFESLSMHFDYTPMIISMAIGESHLPECECCHYAKSGEQLQHQNGIHLQGQADPDDTRPNWDWLVT